MKYTESDFPFATLLRHIDTYFNQAGSPVARKKCKLIKSPTPTLSALRSLIYLAKCLPSYLSIKEKEKTIGRMRPLASAGLVEPVLNNEVLLAFDLCMMCAPDFKPMTVNKAAQSLARHPACSSDIINRLKQKSFFPDLFTYHTKDGQLCIAPVNKPSLRADQELGDRLRALLAPSDAKCTKKGGKAAVASLSTSNTQPKAKPVATASPAPAAQMQKPKPQTIPAATAQPIPTPPASTLPKLPQAGILSTTERHTIYLARSRTVAATLASAIVALAPDQLAFATTGDHSLRDLSIAIDLVQFAIPNPTKPAPKDGAPQPTLVFLWDLARAANASDRAYMIESFKLVLTSVAQAGGKIVVHDVESLGEGVVAQDWFDLGAVVDTSMVFTEWCTLAHEAQGLVALVDAHAKDSSRKVPASLVMTTAQRAKLLAPVAQEHVALHHSDPTDTVSHVLSPSIDLNAALRACHLPLDTLRSTVDALVQKDLVAFHESTIKKPVANHDDDLLFNLPGSQYSTYPDLDSGIGSSHAPSPPSYSRKQYWNLHSDPLLLARAAAYRVDQLLAALRVMDANVVLLEDWKRRAKTYLAATQHLYHGQWSLNPRLPKYIPIQSRFTDDGRLMWRYSVSAARGIEGDGGEQDIGAAGASEDLQLVHEQFTHRTEEEVQDLFALLPDRVRAAVLAIPDAVHSLNEVILDLGEPARLRFFALDQAAMDLKHIGRVTQEDIDAIVEGRMFSSDRRGGINGQLHRISWVANREGKAIGLTIRVGRACPPGEGVTQMLLDLVTRGESVLFLGKPGSGKTHTLRDFVARLSDTGNNVMIVDTSNEVGGPGDVKHFSLHKARRLQVRDRSRQFEVLLEAVQNHTPDIVCIDEISDAKEVAAARSVATRVKGMVATAHGDLESILRNKVMRDLLGGLQTATVGDARAKELGGRKTVTTRAEESLFTTVVELVSRTEVRVFQNVGRVVDMILHPHGFPWAERRWLPSSEDDGLLAGRSSVSDRGGNKFFLAQVEPFEKPDLEGPQGLGTA